MKNILYLLPLVSSVLFAQNPINQLIGGWQGIEMYQDDDSYDGKTYYLPNSGEMYISEKLIKSYYYPYSKISESSAEIKNNTIYFTINGSTTPASFKLKGDTLVLSMFFINKTFLKLYKRFEMDEQVMTDLDQYGFRPASLEHEFELDTFRNNMKSGFPDYDSLDFIPFNHLKFLGNEKMQINKADIVPIKRNYKTIQFDYRKKAYEYGISQVSGTQTITLIPKSQCQCDSIILPYMTVSWADRVREAISEYNDF